MLNKNKIVVLTIVCLFISVICLTLFIYYMRLDKKKVYEIEPISTTGRLYIPVEINNKKYNFLFDTGASNSSIDQELIQEHNIKLNALTERAAVLSPTYKIIEIKKTKKIKFKISDKYYRTCFNVIDCRSVVRGGLGLQGIIGMEIIGRYFWFFDFYKDKVYFSKSKIKVNKFIKVLEMPYNLESGVPYVSLLLNDSIKEKVMLDTGWVQTIISQSKENPEIKDTIGWIDLQINGNFEKSKLFYYLKHEADEHPTLKDKKTLIMSRKIKINDYSVKNLLTYHADNSYEIPDSLDFISNKLTAGFIKRFDGMSINPFDKKITFYINAEDLTH